MFQKLASNSQLRSKVVREREREKKRRGRKEGGGLRVLGVVASKIKFLVNFVKSNFRVEG